MTAREAVYAAINGERTRQAKLWTEPHLWGEGDCSNPELPAIVKLGVLMEEVGEVARCVLDRGPSTEPWDDSRLRAELTQVAAVAVAWLESL